MMMRDAFHEEIDAIGQSLLNMAGLVNQAMSDATKALVNADLSLACLIDADLSYCDFTGADLRNANLTGADLIGAIFTDANLQGCLMTHPAETANV